MRTWLRATLGLSLGLPLALLSLAPAGAQTDPQSPTIKLVLERAGGDVSPLALRGTRFRVRGIVKPYIPGQKVTVRIQRGSRKLRVKQVSVIPGGAAGQFVLGYTPRRTGSLRVRASHLATPEMGTVAARGNMATDLFQACNAVFSGIRGALANATIGACALFGAICGSSIATAATFSQVAIPEMRRHGYDPALMSMRGIFVAAGPAFRQGATVPAFENIHIYDVLAQVLGVTPAPNDGNPDVAKSLLR